MGSIAQLTERQSSIDQADDPIEVETTARDAQRTKILERLLKKRGFKAKIHAFCCHCIFDPYQEGTWLKQVEKCTSLDCPLYSVRPTSGGYHKGTDQGSLAMEGVK